MTHAERCPICNGKGTIPENYGWIDPTNTSENEKTCHGCGGKGWIEVSDQQYIPYEMYTSSGSLTSINSNNWTVT